MALGIQKEVFFMNNITVGISVEEVLKRVRKGLKT